MRALALQSSEGDSGLWLQSRQLSIDVIPASKCEMPSVALLASHFLYRKNTLYQLLRILSHCGLHAVAKIREAAFLLTLGSWSTSRPENYQPFMECGAAISCQWSTHSCYFSEQNHRVRMLVCCLHVLCDMLCFDEHRSQGSSKPSSSSKSCFSRSP